MANLGLLCIIGGWVIQLLSKSDRIQTLFLVAYALGVFLLIIDAMISGLYSVAFLNTGAFIVAALVYFQLQNQGKYRRRQ